MSVRAGRLSPSAFDRGWAAPASWLGWALAGAALAGVAAALGAGILGVAGEPVCWLKRVAHVSCPTCGLTRSLALLARGDLAGSLAMHPWGPVLAAQAVAAWLAWGAWLAGQLNERPDRWIPRAVALNGVALAALWVVRLITATLP
jgi:hypothetical protein